MNKAMKISNQWISLDDIEKLTLADTKLQLDRESKTQIKRCRKYLEKKLEKSEKPFYGINTGFGALCNEKISEVNLSQLQENLVLSHACGSGEMISEEISRLILFLKIKSLSFGYSGVRLELVERLIELYNLGVSPVIYELGSLGASGDLAPLAHLSLMLIGRGEVYYQGKRMSTGRMYKKAGLSAMTLRAKEGLALLNGTQFSLAFAIWSILHARKLYRLSNYVAAISAESYLCNYEPFDEDIHRIRGQKGQIETAKIFRALFEGSTFAKAKKNWVQDPYSFRCIPQVHGATKDSIDHVATIVERELNAVTDNPNIFAEKDKILTGGNFHAQPMALNLDYLSIAIAELGSISERRTFKLVNGDRGLPDFLVKEPGLNSGFMITQYTAASIVSQNKQLCHPASVDSITSSKGQEDHVSMAANAGTKCKRVVENIYRLLAIELFTAGQAIEFRRPKKSSKVLETMLSNYRKEVRFLKTDRLMHDDMVKTESFLRSYPI